MLITDKFCPKCEKVTQHTDGKCSVCSNIEESTTSPVTPPNFVED
jgi:RNA polymerase subunit RPABC4/transcription elongation factor Spt4